MKDCILVAKELFPDNDDVRKMIDGLDGRLKNFDKGHKENAVNAACNKYMDTSDFKELIRMETILNQATDASSISPSGQAQRGEVAADAMRTLDRPAHEDHIDGRHPPKFVDTKLETPQEKGTPAATCTVI